MMVRTDGVAGLTFVAMILCSAGPSPAQQPVQDVTFDTNVVPNTPARLVRLKARLHLSSGPDPYSVVVIMPSSGGVKSDREVFYAERLAAAGIAALVVDSYGSRGLANSIYDQSALTTWQASNDAFGALRWLTKDRRFRKNSIGVTGVSKGGGASLNTAMNFWRGLAGISELAFAAHVPVVPPCQWVPRSSASTGAPMLFLLAELDDQTPAAACLRYAESLRRSGNTKVEIRMYEGIHHAWETLGDRPYYDVRAENYGGCRAWIEDDASSTSADDGSRIPPGTEYDWARKNCMISGTHCCGGTVEQRNRGATDIIAFFKKHGF